jgi:transcriptional regulator with XRE-family HTH domain
MANTERGAARAEGAVGHQQLGAQVRAERQRRALSVRELARRIGVSASLISQVETGRAQPSVTTLMALVTELELSLDSLFSDGAQPGGADARRAGQFAGPWSTDVDRQGCVQAPAGGARRRRGPRRAPRNAVGSPACRRWHIVG